MIEAETLELLEWRRLGEHLATFTSTKLGAHAARHLPIPEHLEASLRLLNETKEVYTLEENLTSGWKFDGIYDFASALERAEYKGILSGETLIQIATTLAGVRRLRRVIDELEESPRLKELISQVRTYPELEKEINRCLDDKGKVTERASPKLGEIRQNIKERRDRIYQKLQNIMQQQSGAIQESVITQRGERFVLPVKAGHKETIRGIVHDSSSTGATLYIEPNSVVELGNQKRQYIRQEQREEERILQVLTEQVAEVKEDLELLLAVATQLDLATARSRYSLWLEANPPRFVESNSSEAITLRRLRHPLLVWQHHHEQGPAVVPIDVKINPETRVVAITGPNTGGKTVTLKTVGLAALMAKVGLFIPAKEPVEIPWFEQVLADIGDEQSLEQSLSTFSGHIRRITRIIDALQIDETPIQASLVLLDEVGAGTDPAEGSAIAIALLQYLAERVRLTIATTHYGELKALKYQDERFENASVEFDDETLSPTYRLLWGIPGRSNALTIARRLGLESEILESAKNKMGGYSEEINQVIAGLEKQRREQEEKAQEARQLLEQAEKFYQEVSSRAKALEARETDLKRSQEQAVNDAVTEAREKIAQVIKQLQQGEQTGQAAQKATARVNEIATRHRPKTETSKPKYQPQVGEQVRLPKFDQTGEVLTAPNAEGKLTIRFGLMKMTVSLADIESLDGKKPEVPQKQQKASSSASKQSVSDAPTVRTESNTLDIRGYRVNQAESQLENAIRSQNSGALWVIHGKGTGKLRQGVQEFLKQHPQVKRYEAAPQNEGGSGVTVVYLQ